MIRMTRRYAFSAAHVLARPDWSDERNQAVYGKCANPAGHGHNYGIEVTVTGPIDETTGQIADPERLDESRSRARREFLQRTGVLLDLLVELEPSARKRSEDVEHRCPWRRERACIGRPKCRTRGNELELREGFEPCSQIVVGRNQRRAQGDERLGMGLDRGVSSDLEESDRLNHTVSELRNGGCLASENLARGMLRIDRIALALGPPNPSARRSAHLDYGLSLATEEPRQPGSVRTGSLNAEGIYAPKAARPRKQPRVSFGSCRYRQLGEATPQPVESYPDVLFLVSVDSNDDFVSCQCDA